MSIRARAVRYRSFLRTRQARRFIAWLDAQAARLEMEPEEVFALLRQGNTAAQIEVMEPSEPDLEP
jgi:hypothetical protein